MKKVMLMIAASLFLLTACGEKKVSYDIVANTEATERETTKSKPTKTKAADSEIEETDMVPTSETAVNVEDAAYNEYLLSLQYLDEVEDKMSGANTTADMVSVSNEILNAWDYELNRIYGLLSEKLSTAEMDELRRIQRSWITERDQQAEQYAATFEGGSFAQVAYVDILGQCTRQRTYELISIYFDKKIDYSFAPIAIAGFDGSDQGDGVTEAYGKTSGADAQSVYKDILQHRDLYAHYYAVTSNIPSDDDAPLRYSMETEPYYYAICDVNGDGIEELLLGYGMRYQDPWVLLNILQYDKETRTIIDVDGERTYPLMDGLTFYKSGYFSTQNGVSDLYTEYWHITDREDHYWYGYERVNSFYDFDGREIAANDFYNMIGNETITVEWKEITDGAG